jgi:hypothetical protein
MKQRLVPLALACVLGLSSFRLAAQERQASGDAATQASRMVITLSPKVVLEQSTSTSHIQDVSAIESALGTHAISELKARQYTTVAPENLRNSDAIDCLKQLQPLSSRLARGAFNDEALQLLGHLATLPQDSLILVQFARIKEGPRGSWNPMNGAITSGMSSTLLQAALIATRTGQVVWKSELQERKVLTADDPKLEKDLRLLYKTLNNSGGNI